MEFVQLSIPEVILIKSTLFEDNRGFFMESYHIEKFNLGGINNIFGYSRYNRHIFQLDICG